MTVLIDNRSKEKEFEGYQNLLISVIIKCLEYEGFSQKCEVSLSFVDSEEIRLINKQFRAIDKETDVLSFPLLTFAENEIPDKNEIDEIMLGDIIISVSKAKQQAEEYGHSIEREVAFLTAHSMLHLLGYDHMEEEEEKIMNTKQEEILQQLGIER
ncbi:MAG: rRNA maturation RNase YbeY [Anaerotignaceae bacterium]